MILSEHRHERRKISNGYQHRKLDLQEIIARNSLGISFKIHGVSHVGSRFGIPHDQGARSIESFIAKYQHEMQLLFHLSDEA
jgi:hypothetical protein